MNKADLMIDIRLEIWINNKSQWISHPDQYVISVRGCLMSDCFSSDGIGMNRKIIHLALCYFERHPITLYRTWSSRFAIKFRQYSSSFWCLIEHYPKNITVKFIIKLLNGPVVSDKNNGNIYLSNWVSCYICHVVAIILDF